MENMEDLEATLANDIICAQTFGMWTAVLLFMEKSNDDSIIGDVMYDMLQEAENLGPGKAVIFYQTMAKAIAWHEVLSFDEAHRRITHSFMQKLSADQFPLFNLMMDAAKMMHGQYAAMIVKKGM